MIIQKKEKKKNYENVEIKSFCFDVRFKTKKKGTQPCLALSALIVTNRWETIFSPALETRAPDHCPGITRAVNSGLAFCWDMTCALGHLHKINPRQS